MKYKSIVSALMITVIFSICAYTNTAYAAGEQTEGDMVPPLDAEYSETQVGEQSQDGMEETESYIPPEGALTPGGSADILDHIIDGNKEFYTFTTPAGNVFYLVIDHIRDQENVYFLNAVTEADLIALAQKENGKSSVSAIPSPSSQNEQTTEPSPSPDEETEQPQNETAPNKMDSNTLIFLAIGAVLVGIAGYYIKIVKPKNNKAAADDEEYEDEDDGDSKHRSRRDEDDEDDYDDFDDE